MGPLDQALGLRVGGLADHHFRAQRAAERLAVRGQLGPPGPPPADRALPVPHQRPRHRAQRRDQLPPAGEQVRRRAGREQQRRSATASTRTPSSAPAAAPAAHLPAAHRQRDRREPEITLRELPGRIRGPGRRIRRQVRRPQLRTRSCSTRTAVPADPLGDHHRRHRRIRLQQFPDPRLDRIHDRPAGGRSYFGGRSLAIAARTVFLETPIIRAIALTGIPSARCSLRISAQSSTESTPSSLARIEPGSSVRGSKFGCRPGVSIHPPPTQPPHVVLGPRVGRHSPATPSRGTPGGGAGGLA